MKLLVIRHAIAEERRPALFVDKRDLERRLTDEGRSKMRKAARALREISPTVDVLATSPLRRARETADIIAKTLDIPTPRELADLAPDGDPQKVIGWLGEQNQQSCVAVVGHEPYLSAFVSLLLDGAGRSRLIFKKGACCLIGFGEAPATGKGTLLWLLQPRLLRKIAR